MDSIFRRRPLPHLDVADGTYFVTAALAGSGPARGLAREAHASGSIDAVSRSEHRPALDAPAGWLPERQAAWEWALDAEPLIRWLARPDLAEIVQRAILHAAGTNYDLLAHVVMPSHIHLVLRPREDSHGRQASRGGITPRQRILHSIRGYSARACNRVLGRTGAFWQRESHDRWLRNDAEVDRAVDYVIRNPVTAGLCDKPEDWPFSSVSRRTG